MDRGYRPTRPKIAHAAIYMSQCSICHGESDGFPSRDAFPDRMGNRMNSRADATAIKNGNGRMPGFPNLTEDQNERWSAFLLSGESKSSQAPHTPASMPYPSPVTTVFDPEGYPA